MNAFERMRIYCGGLDRAELEKLNRLSRRRLNKYGGYLPREYRRKLGGIDLTPENEQMFMYATALVAVLGIFALFLFKSIGQAGQAEQVGKKKKEYKKPPKIVIDEELKNDIESKKRSVYYAFDAPASDQKNEAKLVDDAPHRTASIEITDSIPDLLAKLGISDGILFIIDPAGTAFHRDDKHRRYFTGGGLSEVLYRMLAIYGEQNDYMAEMRPTYDCVNSRRWTYAGGKVVISQAVGEKPKYIKLNNHDTPRNLQNWDDFMMDVIKNDYRVANSVDIYLVHSFAPNAKEGNFSNFIDLVDASVSNVLRTIDKINGGAGVDKPSKEVNVLIPYISGGLYQEKLSDNDKKMYLGRFDGIIRSAAKYRKSLQIIHNKWPREK